MIAVPVRTAAALEARRRATQQKVQQVRDAITELSRGKAPVTYLAVARRAAVSRTFLYENPDARALAGAAMTKTADASQPIKAQAGAATQQEANWRERALNAEDALKADERQPDPRGTAAGRTLQRPLRRPAHRPARSPAHRARPGTVTKHPPRSPYRG